MRSIWRLSLPGFAFLAVVVGGGYATGRELVAFYFSSGPLGGLIAMVVTAAIWSLTMMIVLELCRRYEIHDYKTLFQLLIGPGWIVFEVSYFALLIVVLSIVGAASGEIVRDIASVPTLVGTAAVVVLSALMLFLGSSVVRKVLTYWSIVLYICYAAFFVLFTGKFGGEMVEAITRFPIGEDVFLNGLRYAGVNINCFVSILFLATLLRSNRDSLIAGALVGPVAMLPGLLFFMAIMTFYPAVGDEVVPLNFLLVKLEMPAFMFIFQVAILGTLLQTAVGMLHAVNERVNVEFEARGRRMPMVLRATVALALTLFSVTVAEWIGLVALIDQGYGTLSWIFVAIIFGPVFTVGLWKLRRDNQRGTAGAESAGSRVPGSRS